MIWQLCPKNVFRISVGLAKKSSKVPFEGHCMFSFEHHRKVTGFNCLGWILSRKAEPPQSAPDSLTSPAKSMNAYREMEVRSAKAESALAAIQKDFAIYREEKCENERIISEQVNDTSTSSIQVTANLPFQLQSRHFSQQLLKRLSQTFQLLFRLASPSPVPNFIWIGQKLTEI